MSFFVVRSSFFISIGAGTMVFDNSVETHHVADGGVIIYIPEFYSGEDADLLFASLLQEVPWKQERGRFNRLFPRLTALYADEGLVYKYSGVIYPSLPWTRVLETVRRRVETAAGAPFNSVLLNRYRNGNDSMGYHADAEPELGINPIVPSLSLGAVRRFVLRHKKKKERLEFDLAHGSLLIMAGTLQHFWVHALPKAARPVGERINLTFRNLIAPVSA
jgi:alkylated DNA repair dioxygenase AlkB